MASSIYYKYWECFVAQWYNGKKVIRDWSDPGVPSSCYIPEPWWGNDGTQPLYSVVVNFNPGSGGPAQKHSSVPYCHSYASDIVNHIPTKSFTSRTRPKKGENKQWPYNTAYWHMNRRAKPILNNISNTSDYTLENHLSIELIPWHTDKVDQRNYVPYLEYNIKAVYEHSICFAANESKRIDGKLKNVVLLRMSGVFTKNLLDKLGKKKLVTYTIICEGNVNHGYYLEFSLDKWPGVRFISIWGKYTRNNFPVAQMKDIFKDLKILP